VFEGFLFLERSRKRKPELSGALYGFAMNASRTGSGYGSFAYFCSWRQK